VRSSEVDGYGVQVNKSSVNEVFPLQVEIDGRQYERVAMILQSYHLGECHVEVLTQDKDGRLLITNENTPSQLKEAPRFQDGALIVAYGALENKMRECFSPLLI